MVNAPFKPKHQRLILQCYPAGASVDKKPNPSELSYLLYYVSTRRAKLLKVGAFLEKKTRSDVSRGKAGNVQVTLALLDAIISKCPEHLNIFAENVVNILSFVINSDDIALCQHSATVFNTFCSNHDSSLFNGDSSYVKIFQTLVDNYISLGSKPPGPNKSQWLYISIDAIRGLASSQIVSSGSGSSYIPSLVASLLSNMSSLGGSFIESIEQDLAQVENQKDIRRFSYVLPKDNLHAHDNDSLETQILYLALEALRSLFDTSSIVQIRRTTRAIIEFILVNNLEIASVKTLFVIISRWTPVRFRFLIVLSLMELIKSDTTSLENLIKVCSLVNSILLSSVNMMGLSVIDVTRTFLNKQEYILRNETSNPLVSRLLDSIKSCLGSLTYHIYYTDQVADIVTETLIRCHDTNTILALNNGSHMFDFDDDTNIRTTLQKRSTTLTKHSLSNADDTTISNPTTSSSVAASVIHNREGSSRASMSPEVLYHTLMASKKVLEVSSLESSSNQRSKVPLFSWHGTEFLLNSPSPKVREAYFLSFMTYLQTEVSADETHNLKLAPSFVVNKGFFNRFMNEIFHLLTSTPPIAIKQDFINVQQLLVSQTSKLGLNAITRIIPLLVSLQLFISKVQHSQAGEASDCIINALVSLSSLLAYNIALELKLPTLLQLTSSEIRDNVSKGAWYSPLLIPPALKADLLPQNNSEMSPGTSTTDIILEETSNNVQAHAVNTWNTQDLKLQIAPVLSSLSEVQINSIFSELQPNIESNSGAGINPTFDSLHENDAIVRNMRSLRQVANSINLPSSAASMNSASSPGRQYSHIIHLQQKSGLNLNRAMIDEAQHENHSVLISHDAFFPAVSDLKHAAADPSFSGETTRYASSILNHSIRGDNSRLPSLRASSLRNGYGVEQNNDVVIPGAGSIFSSNSSEAFDFQDNEEFDSDLFLNNLQITTPEIRGRLMS
ncbi:hypothetical protein NADFUDRAFT_84463 [Nadsonia fulvescens var. elongata DSM 6958]|uniref:Protein EFR3 n=1 Tax=Nadsonia fulvescens var. elongata DSM 6958 TaxID=857566 RepID=A0A1E3PD27_9ASCO|nr:hypothetical protein NADFUDRAFT_84463 [Nadsonia fulvescens var. elongata DSM 6958]